MFRGDVSEMMYIGCMVHHLDIVIAQFYFSTYSPLSVIYMLLALLLNCCYYSIFESRPCYPCRVAVGVCVTQRNFLGRFDLGSGCHIRVFMVSELRFNASKCRIIKILEY
jgi:hypothetical protein